MTVFINDHELLRRFRAGERQALAYLYRQYAPSLKNTLKRCISGSSGESSLSCSDLADVVQDVFIKAFSERARLSYDARHEYRPFLFAIARNALVDQLRRPQREVRVDIATIDRIAATEASHQIDPFPWADHQLLMFVERYVAEVAVHERAVYLERYVRGRSQEHAASALGISRQRVRTLESRLRQGLAREMARANLSHVDLSTRSRSSSY
jgi:RNA polymerase sigma factor (sigma-70 family)